MASSAEKYYELLKHEMAMVLLMAEQKINSLTSPQGHANDSTWHENYKNLRRQYLSWRKHN